jgi:hypothetical protein
MRVQVRQAFVAVVLMLTIGCGLATSAPEVLAAGRRAYVICRSRVGLLAQYGPPYEWPFCPGQESVI